MSSSGRGTATVFWADNHGQSLNYTRCRASPSSLPDGCLLLFATGVLQSVETHYNDVIMRAIASQITSLAIVYSTVYWGADQRKHQSSASLVFVRGIHRWPVNTPHKGPVTRKIFPFDDVIMVAHNIIVNTQADDKMLLVDSFFGGLT